MTISRKSLFFIRKRPCKAHVAEKSKESGIDMQSNQKILIVGGGLGGMRSAMDLAEAGRDVILIDAAPAIGGLMTQLDRTFPTNNCDLCTLSPHLSEAARLKHMDIKPLTQVDAVSGKSGDFTVHLVQMPRYIDLEKCTACGECYRAFPDIVRVSPGLDHRAPTCMRYPQTTPSAYSIDMARCSDVTRLVDVCPAGAIVPEDAEKRFSLNVAAIILAPGAAVFDPRHLDNFGYGALPDVVTSLEYERIMSASGPTRGQLLRPSDGRKPEKIAWIHCVGSRGIQKGAASYCSSACCMFSLKEAIVTKERFQDSIETTLFYMDMRTFGKDYERYRERAESEFGVRLVRCRPHSVIQDAAGNGLIIDYTPEKNGGKKTECFDMVVLATGFQVSDAVRELGQKMGIQLNAHKFAETGYFSPVSTSKPGIFVCGMFESPKDIPETLIQASAAACLAGQGVVPRKAETAAATVQVESTRDFQSEAPKIGVFVCDCGLDGDGVMDIEKLVQAAGRLPDVAVSQSVGHGCGRESMNRIKAAIREHALNRVVIGGCSPRTHEAKFQALLKEAGLNPYMLEMANIREQAAWVHAQNPAAATRKGGQLIEMAVAGVRRAQPVKTYQLTMNQSVLVVGGGVAGMNAALSLADDGFNVYLVEQEATLGGQAVQIRRTLDGLDIGAYMKELIQKTTSHGNIEVITNARIVDHGGQPGMFTTKLEIGPALEHYQIEHGVTIMASGARPNRPDDFMLDRHPAVTTQLEMDNLMETDPQQASNWENVVMIQCVGSRCPDNPNCSRVCCQAAVKNALHILDHNPDVRIFVLYRDMRTYGFSEDYYLEARKRGVVFIRYEKDQPPGVTADGDRVNVSFTDPVLGQDLSIAADRLCLSTGFKANDEGAAHLATTFQLQQTDDGYFQEDHIKLRPLDLTVPGFFVAGTAHAPKNIRESIADAQAAAGRAKTLLARQVVDLGAVACVDRDRCAACLVCVRACPYDVPYINADGYSEIDPAKCHGCGICAAECPAKAIQLMQFEDDRILAELEGLLERMVA